MKNVTSLTEDQALETGKQVLAGQPFLANDYLLQKSGNGTQSYVITTTATDAIVFNGRGLFTALERMGIQIV